MKQNKDFYTVCLGVQIPIELHRRIKKTAKSLDMNISQFVRLAVKNLLEQKEQN